MTSRTTILPSGRHGNDQQDNNPPSKMNETTLIQMHVYEGASRARPAWEHAAHSHDPGDVVMINKTPEC